MQYAISDIHANVDELRKLLQELNLQSSDELIFVGDYIDCLPHTSEVLELLFQLDSQFRCTFLKGNHEFLWEKLINEGDMSRKEYLINYGGMDALEEFGPQAQEALIEGNTSLLKVILKQYMELVSRTEDYILTEEYLITHAGLLPEQYDKDPLVFEERNYFIRPRDMDTGKKYMGTHTVVAGHHHIGTEPTFDVGYINIDLGGRQKKFLGAFAIEEATVIRSDGKKFNRP